jgi:hypothetical protein
MMNYYTPDISELHVGFEFEKPNFDGWIKHAWDIHDFSQGRFKAQLKANQIRVKYLDQKDIESLGFEFKHKSIDNWYLINTSFEIANLKYRHVTLKHGVHDNLVVIYGNEYESENCVNDEVLFRGIIKNKSELIKLLKQLNILSDENI